MAIGKISFLSGTLGFTTSFNVLLPDTVQKGEKVPVLYLLHGLSDDHTMWQRRTSIERYADAAGIAVILPDGARRF